MPYLIVNSCYPSDKASETAERYLEALAKYPPDENLGTELVPAAVKATNQGINVITIMDVKKGKLEEAMDRMVNFEAMFLNIVGYEHEIATYYKAEEALAVVGMSMPE